MSDTVIRIENLSQKYVLSHQENGKGYKTFREALTGSAEGRADSGLMKQNIRWLIDHSRL